jgi:argininosuccinate lyase
MTNPGTTATRSRFPADIYRDTVLSDVFADAQRFFLPSLIEIDLAHVVMLAQQRIISQQQAAECIRALRGLNIDAIRAVRYDGSVEDIFFYVEAQLAEAAGEDNAGRIHTARSRNDLDLTMYRMMLRQRVLDVLDKTLTLRGTLLNIAEQYQGAVMPAYTHNQPAQPTTLGHFLMGYVEVLERDAERLIACYARVNRSPLGACAITTTGFPIDREMTMRSLGFRGLVTNSYGAIASVDYVAEACSVLAAVMLSLGRFNQEMLLWSTAEFDYLRLSDGYVQISSIMPQKRNPVPLEHTRILASRALTEAQAVIGSLHNTPFADMNDGEDSLQPLVALAFTDAHRALTLLSGVLSEASFNTAHMNTRAHKNFLTATEVADTLVRTCHISFHRAHSLVSAAVKDAMSDDLAELAQALHAHTEAAGLAITRAEVQQALAPEHSIAVRKVVGGPAPSALVPELQRAQRQLIADRAWHTAETDHLATSHGELLATCAAMALARP